MREKNLKLFKEFADIKDRRWCSEMKKKKYWQRVTVLNGKEDMDDYQQPFLRLPERHPPFTSMTSCNPSTEKSPEIWGWQTTESFSGRKIKQPRLPIYQTEIKALRNSEMPSVNRRTPQAGSWAQPFPALLKPQQDHSQQFFLVPGIMEQLPTGKSLQQEWENTWWLEQALRGCSAWGTKRTSAASPIILISVISWWEWEASFIWSLFCLFASGMGIRSS